MENDSDAPNTNNNPLIFFISLFVILLLGTLLSCWDTVWYVIIKRLYCKYDDNLTPASKHRLTLVKRKTLILDIDETLVTSLRLRPDGSLPSDSKGKWKNVPFDFEFILNGSTVTVYKRPFLDYFLDRVSKWYNLIIFTAATKEYATPILDHLDGGRNILTQRLFRSNCVNVYGFNAKFVSLVCPDLANVILLDNSITECCFNVNNAIPIADYIIGNWDTELLNILPFLDALRFVGDVRSILKRCKKLTAPSEAGIQEVYL